MWAIAYLLGWAQDKVLHMMSWAQSMIRVIAMLMVFGLVSAFAGCGVRGNLDAPKSDDTVHADAGAGQGKPEGGAGKPHKPFILDRLLR